MNVNELGRDIQDLLPDGSAFILVVTESGKEMEPTFVSNLDAYDAIEAMRAIVEAKDQQDRVALN